MLFITFEGIDGSGKTSAIAALKEFIQTNCKIEKFVFTREPGGANLKTAEKIREIVLDKENEIDSKTEALLYLTSRNIHVEKIIKPALEQKKVVICDRYIDSSVAYQGSGRNLGMELVEKLNLTILNNLLPKYTFYIDVDLNTSLERIKKQRDSLDRIEIESLKFFEDTINGYKYLSNKYANRYIVIDGKQPKEKVAQDVIDAFKEIMQKEKLFDYFK